MSAFRELAKKFRKRLECKSSSNGIPEEDKPNEIFDLEDSFEGSKKRNEYDEENMIEYLKKKGIPVRKCGCHYQALSLGKWRPLYDAFDIESRCEVPEGVKYDEEADEEKYYHMVL